jgi:hypothetical protein
MHEKRALAAAKFIPSMAAHCGSGTLGTTESGHLAIVPPLTDPDEEIHVLECGEALVVMRKWVFEESMSFELPYDMYELTGECYLDRAVGEHGMAPIFIH